jgi:protein-S-isoprenylcysteine O-methyltransferase Ste14
LPVALAGAVLFVVGLLLAAQAFWRLGPSLTPLPDPKPGAELVTSGAYARCRHPLYQAVLLCSLGVVLALGSLLHLALLLGLCAVLGGKARREERMLLRLHPGYVAYRAATPGIIPGLPWLDWRG